MSVLTTAVNFPPSIPLSELGIYTPESLDSFCASESKQPWVVEGLISKGSVNITVGDSGLGKSPLLYQLALCIAAGIPWLGSPTTRGTVVYFDLENSELDSQAIRNDLLRHLGLKHCPDNFLVRFDGDKGAMHKIVQSLQPALVIIDS